MLNYENMSNKRDEFANKAKTAADFYGKEYLNTFQGHITALVKKTIASLPVMLSITLGIVAVWLFGFMPTVLSVLLNLVFIGLPTVLLVRWMMKRRDQGKLY